MHHYATAPNRNPSPTECKDMPYSLLIAPTTHHTRSHRHTTPALLPHTLTTRTKHKRGAYSMRSTYGAHYSSLTARTRTVTTSTHCTTTQPRNTRTKHKPHRLQDAATLVPVAQQTIHNTHNVLHTLSTQPLHTCECVWVPTPHTNVPQRPTNVPPPAFCGGSHGTASTATLTRVEVLLFCMSMKL